MTVFSGPEDKRRSRLTKETLLESRKYKLALPLAHASLCAQSKLKLQVWEHVPPINACTARACVLGRNAESPELAVVACAMVTLVVKNMRNLEFLQSSSEPGDKGKGTLGQKPYLKAIKSSIVFSLKAHTCF